MSLDLAAWEDVPPLQGLSPDDAFEAAEDLLEEAETSDPVPATAAVGAALQALAQRWPALGDPGDEDSPWSVGPEIADVAGPVLYLSLTSEAAEQHYDEVVAILKRHGLICYDPQTEDLA